MESMCSVRSCYFPSCLRVELAGVMGWGQGDKADARGKAWGWDECLFKAPQVTVVHSQVWKPLMRP